MGEGLRKKRADQYQQKEDAVAMNEMHQEDLLTASVAESETEFDCELCEDSKFPALHAKVSLIDLKRDRVCVFLGAEQIGWVDLSGSERLREKYRIDQRSGRSISATVTDVAQLSNRFTVAL